MKFSLAFVALVAAVSARVVQKRDGDHYHGEYTTTTSVKTTYVTTCPVTTTKTEAGTTMTDTYTTVSTVTTWIPSTIVITPTETATYSEVTRYLCTSGSLFEVVRLRYDCRRR